MSAREDFMQAAESLLGMPVLWGQKGPDAYDCSGLVTVCLRKVGGPDLRHTHNAQNLYGATRALVVGELPLGGDLVFYGHGPDSIEHVAVYTADGGVVSADGATSRVKDIRTALANESARVRRHNSVHYRRDTPFITLHRNTLVDALDKVTR